MADIIYPDNDNNVIASPIKRERDSVIETDVVLEVTLYDPDGNPVSGATALETSYYPTRQDNYCVIPGDISLPLGQGYNLEAVATGAYLNKITIHDNPCIVANRRG